MRTVLVLSLAVVLASARSDLGSSFAHFKAKYDRTYESEEEEAKRFRVFSENMQRAEELKATNPHASFGVNEYADMSEAEFKTRHNAERFYAAQAKAGFSTKVMPEDAKRVAAGKKQDWRPKGAVTPVKNQGQCGSCWAFSTTGGIEGQWFLAGHPLTSLSEQELVSCDTIDAGCDGGLMDNAFEWLMSAKTGDIVTEASYPYVSGNGNVPVCRMHHRKFGAKIDGHHNLEHSEDAMAAFVYASGPLSIGVDATSWQSYTGGILTNCISTQVDHGVLIVGFDDENQPPYWIVKNSWGKTWGEHGFIRIEKGTDQCLLTSNPCTSEVKSVSPTPTPGPGPTPPAPPTPPPSPTGPTFTQQTCLDPKCQQCSNMIFEQNTCLTGSNSSFKASCITDGLLVESFKTRDCSGTSKSTVNPINTCSVIFRKDKSERFVQNICGTPPPPPPPGPTTPPAPPSPPGPTAGPTPAPTFPSGWLDMFAPPYTNVPTITMAISAIDNSTSYVPGGENGAGFTVFEFNNEENGQFTPMQMPDMALMILGIAVGGTPTNPKGVVGGIGIGNGVQYFANTTDVLPSKIPTLLVQTQDARMNSDGTDALVVDGASNSVLYSSDSGKSFNEKKISNVVNSNCSGARYAAMVDSQTYYVTLGSWPAHNNNNNNANNFQVSATRRVVRGEDKKVRRTRVEPVPQASVADNQCQGYTAQIVKTTDGGNTWTTQYSSQTDFYFNAVDCVSATHCIAVGEGFDSNPGGHIYMTTDGQTWKQVFFEPSSQSGQYSFMSIRFSGKDGKEAWVGGSKMVSQVESTGIFYKTADGGKTWKLYPHGLPNIGEITTLSFVEGGVGFATAMTIFDDSTILRYDPTGPPPPGFFIQSHCPSAGCNFLCQNVSFPQDMCLPLNGGGSALAKCTSTAVDQNVYQTTDCTGSYNVTSMPLDKCLDDNGSYFENYCPPSSTETVPPLGKRMRRSH